MNRRTDRQICRRASRYRHTDRCTGTPTGICRQVSRYKHTDRQADRQTYVDRQADTDTQTRAYKEERRKGRGKMVVVVVWGVGVGSRKSRRIESTAITRTVDDKTVRGVGSGRGTATDSYGHIRELGVPVKWMLRCGL